MNIQLTLLCCFFLSLQDRISSSANAPNNIYGAAGEKVRVQCAVSFSVPWKIFCRENCEKENILIKTRHPTYQSGRYRTEVREASANVFSLYVSISELTRSDEGQYRCGVDDSSSSGSYQDFRLIVADALLDRNNVPHLHKDAGSSLTVTCCFKHSGWKRRFCRGECGKDEVLVQTDGVGDEKGRYNIKYEGQKSGAFLLVTITQLVQSDSGRYRCILDGTGSSSSHRDFQVTVRTVDPSASTPSTGTSFSSSSGSFTPSLPSETSGLNQENSGSKDSANHRSAEVLWFVAPTLVFIIILSSVVLLVCCRKRSEKHHTDSPPATEAEDVSAQVVYADVKFCRGKAASRPRASCGTRTDVLYAEPRVDGSSHDESLYSTITQLQLCGSHVYPHRSTGSLKQN